MFKIIFSSLLVMMLALQLNAQKQYTEEELNQMLAPIALYPDALLSQVLMATTFEEQLNEAIAYSKANPDEKGDDAVKKVQDKDWDASVASLVAFPQVLSMLGKKPEWSKDLGKAFLAQPESIMDTVQSLRKKAKGEGNLKSSKEQEVKVDDSNTTQVITIAPATTTVYVPVYNPTYVYGPWMYPAYPPYYYYPPYYNPVPGFVFGFTFGVIASNCMWGGFGWHSRSVNINVNRYNNINVNKISSKKNNVDWKQHNQRANKQKLSNKRGSKDSQRMNARKAMQKQGLDPSKQRKNLSGSSGANIRNDFTSGKFNSDAFSGMRDSGRAHSEANRGGFSRANSGGNFKQDRGFSHSGGFSNSGGFSRSGGGNGFSGAGNRSFGGGGFRGRR